MSAALGSLQWRSGVEQQLLGLQHTVGHALQQLSAQGEILRALASAQGVAVPAEPSPSLPAAQTLPAPIKLAPGTEHRLTA